MAHDHYSSKCKYDPPPASPSPPDKIQLAKQRAQEIAARFFNSAEARRPLVDNGYDDVGIGRGSFGGSGRSSSGGLGFSSSAGGGTPEQISKAEQLVNEVLAEADAGSSGNASGGRRYNAPQLKTPTCLLPINSSTSLCTTSSSPSFRSMQGGQRCKKRESPYSNIVMFRSPLSKMMLSLRPGMLSPRVTQEDQRSKKRSPCGARGNIDLNEEPEMEVNTEMKEASVEPEMEVNTELEEAPNARRKEVPNDIRKAIFEALLARSKVGCLKGHETEEVSAEFSVHIRTVQRIWLKGKRCIEQGIPVDVSSEKSSRGRKKKVVDLSKLRDLPISSRTTLEDVSKELGCSKSKLHSMKREGVIQRVSNSIKPFLTEKNKKERLKWCISMLDPRSVPTDPVFKGLFNFIFIDEKWFNITRKTERYYKAPDEEQPTRTCKNKNFIQKIMILCALARPRFDSQANCTFDGKIGCFPFVIYEAAKRSSKNRRAGTIEMKPMDSIRKDVSREFLIDKVLPAIRAKWPREDANKPIYIQQDNAPSHIDPNDKLFCEAAKQDGFMIELISQPPNSPDFNILDLGFFNAIQSIQYKTSSKTIEELVATVDKAFQEYPPSKADRIFLTLHGCLNEAMKIGGGNGYDVPHIRKGMLEKQGHLPLQLSCEAVLVQEAIAKLNE